jgi:photosystem II stability/assembly factor-like uncharacterized protein
MFKTMSIYKLLLGVAFLLSQNIVAQNSIKILTEKKGISIRGLSVPSENVIWASGSKGSVVKSEDGGASFSWMQIKGYEQRDFRSIHAWNDKEAVIVAIASPAYILKTKDGGLNWYKVYENVDTAMFLDAIHFKDNQNGIVVGDPLNSYIFQLITKDKGETWDKVPDNWFSEPLKRGEAFFASSSSNIAQSKTQQFLITGGMASRLWINGKAQQIPIIQGKSSTGANSIALSPNSNHILIVGGDFANDTNTNLNIVGLNSFLTPNTELKQYSAKKTIWTVNNKVTSPNGYKSAIAYLTNKIVVTCGTSGVDVSKNNGRTWQKITGESFHVVKKQPNTNKVIFAGNGGRIGVMSIN